VNAANKYTFVNWILILMISFFSHRLLCMSSLVVRLHSADNNLQQSSCVRVCRVKCVANAISISVVKTIIACNISVSMTKQID
jgi:hypothetical protein